MEFPRDRSQEKRQNVTLTESEAQINLRGVQEKPVKVASRSKLTALWFIARFHLPSLVISLFLVGIHAAEWLWPLPGPSQDVLGALQFAAKIHEGLIVLSLSTILLHRLRYLFMRSEGVPLGLLTSPWQLSSPMYFLSLEFWGSAIKNLTLRSHLGTLALLSVCCLLTAAIGPFSAIVMLPYEDYRPIPSSFEGMQELRASLQSRNYTDNYGFRFDRIATHPSSGLYFPMNIGPELGVSWECTEENQMQGCQNHFTLIVNNAIGDYNVCSASMFWREEGRCG